MLKYNTLVLGYYIKNHITLHVSEGNVMFTCLFIQDFIIHGKPVLKTLTTLQLML